MKQQAIDKINTETKEFKGDQYSRAVYTHVADVLKNFAEQDAEFAQAIVQTDRTLSDCCKEVMKGVHSAVSDIEVYKRAVAFYFPGAGIRVSMTVDLCASVRGDQEEEAPAPGVILSLDDFI